ncbi:MULTISPECIES: hypothetical protein [Roseivirga]|jgi:hypothetical protein|uniref:Membrane protein n=1 Tax=Roseivirga thermotolerans TaxID=1758176 RepID=A0ABQ3I5G1_9BACT|nr:MULTISPECIES: hypothetical protein [Roseivirga]GHE55982.1 membrane protein [Roseivirga thermotolerans]|tara:strand:+ start:5885 stop:7201 length:1317 start_codon:yes stop_codon:yes gene_type:complete
MLESTVIRGVISKARSILLASFVGLFTWQSAVAQVDQSSYSVFGVGSLNWSGYAHNAAMGGLGISNNSKFFFNDLNPALLGTNAEAVFQLGTALDYRSITNGQSSYSTMTGGFKDFGLSMPLIYNRWNVGLSLNPYSSVSYGFVQQQNGPEGGTTLVDVSGVGGIDQINLSSSVSLGNFTLGLKATYYYGSINNEDRFTLQNVNTNFATTIVKERRSFSELAPSVGLLYDLRISDNSGIHIGAYYNPAVDIKQTTLVTFENETNSGNLTSSDTLVYDKNLNRTITIPERMGFGISYEKFRKLTIGLDVQLQDWNDYRNRDGLAESYYGKSMRVAFGGEFIPNFDQPSKLLNVSSFRFGFHYEKTPFLVNNESVNDVGINFGVSLPLTSFWGLSHVNFGATLGQRGNISTVGLIRENYVTLNLGFSLQDITWFTKQRFN